MDLVGDMGIELCVEKTSNSSAITNEEAIVIANPQSNRVFTTGFMPRLVHLHPAALTLVYPAQHGHQLVLLLDSPLQWFRGDGQR